MIKQKASKRYHRKTFTYWWDISPEERGKINEYDAFEFIAKDTGRRCRIDCRILDNILTPERRTSRSGGNWGIKVLVDSPANLSFEPGTSGGDWFNLTVDWEEGEVIDPSSRDAEDPGSPARRAQGIHRLEPPELDGDTLLGLADTLAQVSHFVHPDVVKRIQRANIEQRQELLDILPPEIDPDDYLYDGSACVFPGVRRGVGSYDQKRKDETNKYNPANAAIIDLNMFPRYFWSYLLTGRGYGGPIWKESGMSNYELAHVFSHKINERDIEEEAFKKVDESVKPWGLFTCASNVVPIPKGLAKPTDHLRPIQLVFMKRSIELYGEGILPGLAGLKPESIPIWYDELNWSKTLLPDHWESHIERLLVYRVKRLKAIFSKPVGVNSPTKV